MAWTLSNYVLDKMGFREVIEPGQLSASFLSVTVYEARGLVVPDNFCEALMARVAGADYRIAISQSVNAGCRAIEDDDFCESESEWLDRVKSKGPFVLIGVGPSDFFGCTAGRMQRNDDGSVTTYDSFPEARAAMRTLEQRVIPPILAAMTCALNKPDLFVALKKLERGSSARCTDGTHLHDIRFEGKAELYVSRPFDQEVLQRALTDVTSKAPQMNPKSAKFFSLGLGEDDELKRFLNFFLALEIHTHAVFSRIDHHRHVTSLTSAVPSASHFTSSMLKFKIEALTNLFDRFVWCAACVWTDLTESDVSHFLELKKARDAIAHGDKSEPPAGFARSAQLLAHKILWR